MSNNSDLTAETDEGPPSSAPGERIRDEPGLMNHYLNIVKEHQMLEKGLVTKAELDKLGDRPLWIPPEWREEEPYLSARKTLLKIVQMDDPDADIDEIE